MLKRLARRLVKVHKITTQFYMTASAGIAIVSLLEAHNDGRTESTLLLFIPRNNIKERKLDELRFPMFSSLLPGFWQQIEQRLKPEWFEN